MLESQCSLCKRTYRATQPNWTEPTQTG